MRETFHEQLDDVAARLTAIIERIGGLMQRASAALLAGDVSAARQVVAEGTELEAMRNEVESLAFRIMAQQAPVATDLRRLISANHVTAELERMGALAGHIAKIAAGTPSISTIQDVRPSLERAGQLASTITELTTELIRTRDLSILPLIRETEASMDVIRAELFKVALDPGWSHGIEACIRLTEAGRYYERYADHAENIAESITFIVTGS